VILVRRAPGQRIASATRFAATLIADRFTQPSERRRTDSRYGPHAA
jgi:hypothetical protein